MPERIPGKLRAPAVVIYRPEHARGGLELELLEVWEGLEGRKKAGRAKEGLAGATHDRQGRQARHQLQPGVQLECRLQEKATAVSVDHGTFAEHAVSLPGRRASTGCAFRGSHVARA